jgi:hypothetical protein
MLGGGDGTFQAGAVLGAAGPVSIGVGDFNADTREDLAIGNYFTSKLSVFVGMGGGAFQSAGYYTVGNDPVAIAVADLNGDSKSDLAVANVNDHYVSILQGKGDGTFLEALNYGVGKGPSATAVGDFNGDGKFDIAMTSYWFNGVSILLNNCNARPPAAVLDGGPGTRREPVIEAIAPNPAAASAWVQYSIPFRTFVDLSVFDVAGRRVATLVSRPQDPGRYFSWIRSGALAPGDYRCRLVAGGVTRSRSLIVLY